MDTILTTITYTDRQGGIFKSFDNVIELGNFIADTRDRDVYTIAIHGGLFLSIAGGKIIASR